MFKLLMTILFVSFTNQAFAAQTIIAVAANFAMPLQKIVEKFEAETNHKISISIGSSGKIYAQIINGAPYDVFFSADQSKPKTLLKDGFGVKGSLYTYAIGRLVFWAPKLEVFTPVKPDDPMNKIAIANPKIAPYGVAAMQAMAMFGLTKEEELQVIRAENVAQVYQFVDSGVVGMGFVALSQVLDQSKNGYIIVKPEDYTPIKQDVILLNHGQNNQAAIDFMAYIKTKNIRDMIKQLGYK